MFPHQLLATFLLTIYAMPVVASAGPTIDLPRQSNRLFSSIPHSAFIISNRAALPRTRRRGRRLSSSPNNNDDDRGKKNGRNSDKAFSRYIQKQGESNPDYKWFQDRSSLPFECTSCGKCCQTKGHVYMNPDEFEAAANLLEVSKQDFIQQFASHKSVETKSNGEERVWIRLRDDSQLSENDQSKESHGCIFLKEDNTCRIYEARPTQCSTYPFWPDLLASKKAWNDEVRRLEVDESTTSDNTTDATLPPKWTPEIGGCEGMQRIGDEYDDEEVNPIIGVPLERVYEEVYWCDNEHGQS